MTLRGNVRRSRSSTYLSRCSTLSDVDTLPESFYASNSDVYSDVMSNVDLDIDDFDAEVQDDCNSLINEIYNSQDDLDDRSSSCCAYISSRTVNDVNSSIFNLPDPVPFKGSVIHTEVKGKFFDDSIFEDNRKCFLETVRNILFDLGVVKQKENDYQVYRLIRSTAPTSNNQVVIFDETLIHVKVSYF